jgi:hypothetical protein
MARRSSGERPRAGFRSLEPCHTPVSHAVVRSGLIERIPKGPTTRRAPQVRPQRSSDSRAVQAPAHRRRDPRRSRSRHQTKVLDDARDGWMLTSAPPVSHSIAFGSAWLPAATARPGASDAVVPRAATVTQNPFQWKRFKARQERPLPSSCSLSLVRHVIHNEL